MLWFLASLKTISLHHSNVQCPSMQVSTFYPYTLKWHRLPLSSSFQMLADTPNLQPVILWYHPLGSSSWEALPISGCVPCSRDEGDSGSGSRLGGTQLCGCRCHRVSSRREELRMACVLLSLPLRAGVPFVHFLAQASFHLSSKYSTYMIGRPRRHDAAMNRFRVPSSFSLRPVSVFHPLLSTVPRCTCRHWVAWVNE